MSDGSHNEFAFCIHGAFIVAAKAYGWESVNRGYQNKSGMEGAR